MLLAAYAKSINAAITVVPYPPRLVEGGIIEDLNRALSNSLLQGQSLSSNQYYTYVQMCSKNPL